MLNRNAVLNSHISLSPNKDTFKDLVNCEHANINVTDITGVSFILGITLFASSCGTILLSSSLLGFLFRLKKGLVGFMAEEEKKEKRQKASVDMVMCCSLIN